MMHQWVDDPPAPCPCRRRAAECDVFSDDFMNACDCKTKPFWKQCDCEFCRVNMRFALLHLKRMGGTEAVQ